MEERQPILKGHKLNINARKTAAITGVNDVLSFDAGEVLLQTEQGILMIRGSELHVNRLTLEKGEVDIDGKIDSLTYSDSSSLGKSSENLFGRLFK
ncbi:MAG TPA: sporulation protein YabP [Clostridiales bacterium]|nr:sporulation protein YabP [Clostridiales bacterium]